MASLFIKDPVTAALADKVAGQLGTTKAEAVRRGLSHLEKGKTSAADVVVGTTADWLRAYRKLRPLPDRRMLKIDKAFYDALSDEDDIVDPWA